MPFFTFKRTAMLLAITLWPWMGGCSMQRQFDDPGQAVGSLVESLRAGDKWKVREILGPSGDELLFSGDPVNDRLDIDRFLDAYSQKHQIVPVDDSAVRLNVGDDGWPMPIPIVKDASGKRWLFDTEAGKDEILSRRIGRNELDTMQTCLAIVDAQREYAAADPEKAGLPQYAQKFFSDPGRKNGLYWETGANEPASPLGSLAATAETQGYTLPTANRGPSPFHGYYFRILKSQGPEADGGARDYMVGDHLLGGFGVLAFPASYGTSGIISFIINQDGTLYQRDLGDNTAQEAAKITSFNPDRMWKKVDPSEISGPSAKD